MTGTTRDERNAETLNDAALREPDPAKRLQLLKELIKKYPHDIPTVHNYAVPNTLSMCREKGWWDDAIEVAIIAQANYPDDAKWFILEVEALRLEKDDRHIDAMEVDLRKDTLRGRFADTLLWYADRFAELDKHDKAWRLYNEAITAAASERRSPHKIRLAMAKLLVKESKFRDAADILIIGICEAEEINKNGAPKEMGAALKRALKAAGYTSPSLPSELLDKCQTQGRDRALAFLREQEHT